MAGGISLKLAAAAGMAAGGIAVGMGAAGAARAARAAGLRIPGAAADGTGEGYGISVKDNWWRELLNSLFTNVCLMHKPL